MSGADPQYQAGLAVFQEDLARLVRRLRNLSVGAWRVRRAAALQVVDKLALLSAQLEVRSSPEVPRLANHVLPDALSVIGGDVLNSLRDEPNPAAQTRAIAAIRAALEQTC